MSPIRNNLIFSAVLFCLSCATSPLPPSHSPPTSPPVPLKKTIYPGGVVSLTFTNKNIEGGTLRCGDKVFPHYQKGNHAVAYISESYFSKLKPFSCIFTSGERETTVAIFKVEEKDFPTEVLKVFRKKVILSPRDRRRVWREAQNLQKVYGKSNRIPLFEQSFHPPLNSVVTSIYGTRRMFNNIRRSQHLGIDFRAKIGTPIKVSNRGRVVLVGNLFYSGRTVIVDHGMGIFTVYGHLSRAKVKENEVVEQGQIIGLSGKTGRITGPHLHWGVKVNGNFVDGNYLLKLQ